MRPEMDAAPPPSPNLSALSDVRDLIATTYRLESRRVFATLVRLLGDFDLAEEAVHDAFRAALEQWPGDGVPANPRAWLVSAGRFKAIDSIRRQARFAPLDEIAEPIDPATESGQPDERAPIEDDRLRLIFTCCHPALAPDTQVALTLREVCGLTTEEIAGAYLIGAPTVAQRIVRAKTKIRGARIPYQVPEGAELGERLGAVLRVIYLVFSEGYSASAGPTVTRHDLSGEAIRLGRLLLQLLSAPDAEAEGLLALMLLQESRRAARSSPEGELLLLDAQDRSLWNREQIAEGLARVRRAFELRPSGSGPGAYALQAAIAAVHAQAQTPAQTDWAQIVDLYDALLDLHAAPIVELNRAGAVAMRDGPAAGLRLIDALFERGELAQYHLAHALRADLCRRLARPAEAHDAYRQALALARQEPERRFLQGRIDALARSAGA